jgi:hypothetical protein
LTSYLPSGAYGSILITSRNAALVPKYGGAVLGALDEKSAIQLMRRTIAHGDLPNLDDSEFLPAAYRIVRRLGYFPMAIVEAAHYIASNGERSLLEFVKEYEQNELAFSISQPDLYGGSAEGNRLTLSTIWNMSYENLTGTQQALLNLVSFFDPVGIPLELVSTGAAKAYDNGVESLEFINSDQKFKRCKIGLTRSSLVMQNEYLGQLWMHRVVQDNCQARMSAIDRQEAWNRCLAIMDTMWPVADRNDRHRVDLWPVQIRFLPHIQSLALWFHKYDGSQQQIQHSKRFAELLVQAASFCYVRGFYEPVNSLTSLVEQYAAHSIEDCELLLFESYWAKGTVQLHINEFEDGYQSYEKGYKLLQIAVEKGTLPLPDTRQALACGMMGNGCMAMNKYKEAEDWYLKAFHMWADVPAISKDKQLYVCLFLP